MSDERPALGETFRLERAIPRSAEWFPRRLFLGLRLVTRVAEALTAVQLGLGHPELIFLAAGAFAGHDLWLARKLTHTRRAWSVRLLLDTVDVLAWTLLLHGSGDLTAIVAGPLAYEVGMWAGWYGLAVPLVAGGTTVLVVRTVGYPATPLTFLWPACAAVAGILLTGYLKARWRHGTRVARDEIEAAVSQAELSGQNSVAMGADSVVDQLIRTAPLIAAYESLPSPSPYATWKAELAQACEQHSTYLGVALIRWQRLHNSRSPDLSADVVTAVSPGAGTLLLSAAQARHLEQVLAGLGLRGEVTFDVERFEPVGQQQVVLVGGAPLVIPPDPSPRPRPMHVAPIPFIMGAVWTLLHSIPEWEAVPLWITTPIAAAMLLAAWWVHRLADRGAGGMARRILAIALLLGGVDAVTSTLAMRVDSGRLPFLFFLQWLLPLAYAYFFELRRRERVLLLVGLAGVLAAGAAAMPVAFSLQAVAAPTWLIPPLFIAQGLRDVLAHDDADRRAELERVHDAAVRDGFRSGRRLIIDLTVTAAEDLRRRYRALGPSTPRNVKAEIERRLDEASRTLAAIIAE